MRGHLRSLVVWSEDGAGSGGDGEGAVFTDDDEARIQVLLDDSGSGHGGAHGEDALGFTLERDPDSGGPQGGNRFIGFSRLEGSGIVDDENGGGRQ